MYGSHGREAITIPRRAPLRTYGRYTTCIYETGAGVDLVEGERKALN